MGICYQQHRAVIGTFSSNSCTSMKVSRSMMARPSNFGECGVRCVLYTFTLIVYTYLVCLMLAVVAELSYTDLCTDTYKNIMFIRSSDKSVNLEIRTLVNPWLMLIISTLIKYRYSTVCYVISKFGYVKKLPGCGKLSGIQRIGLFISFWLTMLNLFLIVITNPAIKNPGPVHNDITVLYQNVRGFVPFNSLGKKILPLDNDKLTEFQAYIFEHKPCIVVLNETWLSKEHLVNEIFPNSSYTCHRLDRSAKTHPIDPLTKCKFKTRGGGVLIALRSDLNVEMNKVDIKSKAEILSVELKFDDKEIICLTTCYRVGTLGVANHKEVDNHLRAIALRKKYNQHIVIGDFNLSKTSWPEAESTDRIENLFVDSFNDLGLQQLISNPTHNRGRILDILLANKPGLVRNILVLSEHEPCHSDHFGIKFTIKVKFKKIVRKRKFLNFKKANWEGLNRDLNTVNWDSHLKYGEADISWHRFKCILNDLTHKHIPSVTVKENSQPPWFDNETFCLCRKKERLRKKYKASRAASDYLSFSNCRKEFKKVVKEKMCANFVVEDDPALISKKFWKHLKSVSGSSRIPETVNYNSRFRNEANDKAELFNEFFVNQFSDASKYDIDIDFNNDSNNDIDFNFRRIRKLLKNINVNKSAGPDEIPGRVLKNCASSLAYPLALIFKTSYNTGQIPNDWKFANVVPVHKKGSKVSVENYRPISLTSLVMKIFEKIIRDELMIKCSHKLNSNQHGFLPSKSCTTQMIIFNESIALAMNEGYRVDVVYFDFQKAFDSVNHDIILDKLKKQFNINGTLLKFLVNYLDNRKQCVLIGGTTSKPIVVRSGVPQGSILGPLLFVLFINDMVEVVSKDTKIALYADDTKIWRKISCWKDHEILQHDINALYKWSVENKMKFHPGKCKVLPIGLKNTLDGDQIFPFNIFYYHLNGIDLQFCDSEKDLGVLVTNTFSWNSQVSALYTKASSMLGLLKRNLHFVKCPKQKRAFYLAIVRSQFEHCVQIWRPTCKSNITKLERIQKRAVKWILSELEHHYNDLEYINRLKNLDLLPLRYRFLYSDLTLFYKIYHKKICIDLPENYKPLDDEETSRLRSSIRPPDYLIVNETVNLGCMRNTMRDKLSLKCVNELNSSAYRNSYFFRTVLEWNRLPLELKANDSLTQFERDLKSHLWKIALDPEPD